MYNEFYTSLKREKKFILEVASKRFHSMYNTCPAVSSAWSTESPPRAHWGLGPGGQLGGVELDRVDSAFLSPSRGLPPNWRPP